MKNTFLSFFLLIVISSCAQKATIDTLQLKKHISFLASDTTEGRYFGTKGDFIAANYIQQEFSKLALLPFYKSGIEQFTIKANRSIDSTSSFFMANEKFVLGKDFNPSFLSKIGKIKAQAMIVKDIKKIKPSDIENKWLIINADTTKNANSNALTYNQNSIFFAKDSKAAGVLLIANNESELTRNLSNISIDYNIPIIFISKELENIIFNLSKLDSKSFYNDTTKQTLNIQIDIEANCLINFEQVEGKNVVYELKSNNSGQYIVIGAHYDHLGYGGSNSGSRTPEYRQIHYGADDNASGVAGMIEMARLLSMSKDKLERNVIFIAFDGEEKGLLGSKYFVDNLKIPKDSIIAMFNYDMIGRMKDNKTFGIAGTGTAIELENILKTHLDTNKVKVSFQADGYGGSDQTSFYTSKIPVMFFTTGGHSDYHTPLDTENKINYNGMSLLLNYSYDVFSDINKRTTKLTFKETSSKNSESPAKMKVSLGIMPDVTSSDNKGLRVDGVSPNGAALKAGILKGDVIVGINGQKIANIYEYMHALSKFQKGQEIEVEILRNDLPLKLKVIL
ncbi:MAG: M20/M25/M40 family metallo-hydrolase [Bacteroidota bacterium]